MVSRKNQREVSVDGSSRCASLDTKTGPGKNFESLIGAPENKILEKRV